MAKAYDLRQRTMAFALEVLRFCRRMPPSPEGWHVRGQLFRAGTGVASNYRAACRGKSKADFIAKLGTVIEANELVAIFTQSQKTARGSF